MHKFAHRAESRVFGFLHRSPHDWELAYCIPFTTIIDLPSRDLIPAEDLKGLVTCKPFVYSYHKDLQTHSAMSFLLMKAAVACWCMEIDHWGDEAASSWYRLVYKAWNGGPEHPPIPSDPFLHVF